MTINKDEVLKKIRKLLNRSKDTSGSTEGERDQALRMAHALLARHNLDIAELESRGQVDNDRGVLRKTFYGRPWARSVARAVADMSFCHYLYMSRSGTKDVSHIFVGREANAITASEMSSYLVESINREAKKFQRDRKLVNDSYRAFAWGAAAAITRRCRELRAAAERANESTPGSGSGLVVYQANENAANQELIDKAFPKTSKGRSGQEINDLGAARSGREYGETVSLNRQVSGPSVSDRLRLK